MEKLLHKNKIYLSNLRITKSSYEFLSTTTRTNNSYKTKENWRTTDGVQYPVKTYKASDLKEGKIIRRNQKSAC